jgi:hypothetical protein
VRRFTWLGRESFGDLRACVPPGSVLVTVRARFFRAALTPAQAEGAVVSGPELVDSALQQLGDTALRLHVVDQSRVGPSGSAGVQQSVADSTSMSLVGRECSAGLDRARASMAAVEDAHTPRQAQPPTQPQPAREHEHEHERGPSVSLSGTTVLASDPMEVKVESAAPSSAPVQSIEQAAALVDSVRSAGAGGADATVRLMQVCQVC